MRIERHFKNGGRATGRGGARASFKSFPIGSPWFVEVDVRIDHAGKDRHLRRVDLFACAAAQIRSDRREPSVDNSDVALAAAHEQIEITHADVPHTRNRLTPPSG